MSIQFQFNVDLLLFDDHPFLLFCGHPQRCSGFRSPHPHFCSSPQLFHQSLLALTTSSSILHLLICMFLVVFVFFFVLFACFLCYYRPHCMHCGVGDVTDDVIDDVIDSESFG